VKKQNNSKQEINQYKISIKTELLRDISYRIVREIENFERFVYFNADTAAALLLKT
jgi:GMP synthase PP-ATPase subunit